MRPTAFVAPLLLAALAHTASAQRFFTPGQELDGKISVQINATLNDGIGDYHPVGNLLLTLYRGATDSLQLQTDEAGVLQFAIAPGTYRVASATSVQYHGRNYRWNVPLVVQRRMGIFNLNQENAAVSAGTQLSPRASPASDVTAVAEERSTRAPAPSGGGWASSTKGFLLGLYLNGSAFQADDISDETYSGAGGALQVGFGFTHHLALVGEFAAASVEGEGEDADLAHFDAGLRYAFTGPTRRFAPFLEAGVAGVRISVDDVPLGDGTSADGSLSGMGLMIGGGFHYFPSPTWAVGASLKWAIGELDKASVENVSVSDLDIEAVTARFNLGITWYPMAGR
jgi:hypothetical protein